MVVWKEPTSFIARLILRKFFEVVLDDPHLARGVCSLGDTGGFGSFCFPHMQIAEARSEIVRPRWYSSYSGNSARAREEV